MSLIVIPRVAQVGSPTWATRGTHNFRSQRALEKIGAVRVGDFRAVVDCISDPAYNGLTVEQLVLLEAKSFNHSFVFVVDRTALADPQHPILVVDLYNEPGRTFRVIPTEMWSVENNLSLANMDFFEFADSVDQDGVFRGFPPA